MENSKAYLFGAGAAIAWGGPTTSELTELIRNVGFKCTDNETTITEFLYNTLSDKKKDVNFEMIISAIEELASFHAKSQNNSQPSIIGSLFESKYDSEILNFDLPKTKNNPNWRLNIPKGKLFEYSRSNSQNSNPEVYFFQYLLNSLISSIIDEIIRYSYSYQKELKHPENKDHISELFLLWAKQHEKMSGLRYYTLNYDYLYFHLLKHNSIELFNGFHTNNFIPQNNCTPDIKAIINNTYRNFQYNLHGSIYWNVKHLDEHGFANSEIFQHNFPNLPINNTSTTIEIEKDRSIFISPIITGYQKAQKSMISPFKQMQAAFDRDLCNVEQLYIIGYSFGDEHINQAILTGLRHNKSLKLKIIDPYFLKNKIDEKVFKTLFLNRNSELTLPISNREHNIHYYVNKKHIAFTMTFEEFMKWELDNGI